MFATQRAASRIDIASYNALLYHQYDESINFTNNYLLCQSPPPMSYRDLRTVMSNIPPSNVVVLSDSSNHSDAFTRTNSPELHKRKQSPRKKVKHQTIDVYRSLSRVDSRTSTTHAVDRNTTNEELMLLANSFVIDHLSSSPTSGYFHPQNLPNIQKHRLNNNNNRSKSRTGSTSTFRFQQQIVSAKPTPVDIHYNGTKQTTRSNRIGTSHTKSTSSSTSSSSSSSSSSSNFSSRSQPILRAKPTPPELIHRTTPVDVTYNDEDSEITTATVNYSPLPNSQTRKQLHVYMPQIISC